jgi:hypothetical protein
MKTNLHRLSPKALARSISLKTETATTKVGAYQKALPSRNCHVAVGLELGQMGFPSRNCHVAVGLELGQMGFPSRNCHVAVGSESGWVGFPFRYRHVTAGPELGQVGFPSRNCHVAAEWAVAPLPCWRPELRPRMQKPLAEIS